MRYHLSILRVSPCQAIACHLSLLTLKDPNNHNRLPPIHVSSQLLSSIMVKFICSHMTISSIMGFRGLSQHHKMLINLISIFIFILQNITTHATQHIGDDIQEFGPLHGRWNFPFERSLCWISRQAMNKRYQEQTIMESYRVWLHSPM